MDLTFERSSVNSFLEAEESPKGPKQKDAGEVTL